jgi:glycosyltransferase involved in cell wall biosynthesis
MTQPKTIAIDARIINSSTGRYVERLVTYLQQIDTTNTYIILVRNKDHSFWKPSNPNFTVRVADFDNYSFGEQVGFLKLLNSLKADLVHFCMPQQPLLYFRPHVTTVHDMTLLKTYNSDKNWFVYHAKQLVGRAVFFVIGHTSKHILSPSKFTKEEYAKFAHIPKSNITVTYEAADTHTYSPQPPAAPIKNFLLYVGQQSDYKNIKRLIQAHQQLKVSRPDLKLVLVGRKDEAVKRHEAWVRQHGFTDVIFTGFVPNEQLTWLYQHCATYVFPSLMEGFGLPGLEAMACGAPVVSSQATCLPEIYGEAAHYFDPHNVNDMARAIEEVMSDKTLRAKLIKKGFTQHNKYSWKVTAQQTHGVYLRSSLSRK